MKHLASCLLVLSSTCAGLVAPASAQDRIYRCGNEYTNNAAMARQRDCKLVEGGNVTVVQGTRPAGAAPVGSPSASSGNNSNSSPVVTAPPASRADTGEQRARDADARAILESELRRAEARQVELLKEYNNGEPDKLGPETRNHQKYLDRVAALKADIARNDSDIAGIKRELSRLPAR